MGEKDTITKEDIKYSGLGNFKEAYAFAFGWWKGEGYTVVEGSYSEKIKGNEKDIDISWKMTKGLSDYFKASIDLNWAVKGMTDVEVEIDGKRKQMNKFQELKISLKGVLEKDVKNKWGGTSMQQFLKDVYHKYVIPQRVSEKEDSVKDSIENFKEEVKALFELTARK